jgi:hypothetical protein
MKPSSDLGYRTCASREFDSGNQFFGLVGETFLAAFFMSFREEARACFYHENTL